MSDDPIDSMPTTDEERERASLDAQIPEAWQPFTKEPTATSRPRARASEPRRWTRCVMPTQSASVYCGQPGTWDPDVGATLCEYHSARERFKRELRDEAIAEHVPEKVRLDELIESMKAHPALWRKQIHEDWYGDENASPFLDNRSGK